MAEYYKVEATATIDAPAAVVYRIIADYRDGHPNILPKPYFHDLEVLAGGMGAGTKIRCQFSAYGRTETFLAEITEPEPGRVLVETAPDQSLITTFTVEPLTETQTRVMFETQIETKQGLRGRLERWISRHVLADAYVKELALLADYAKVNDATP